MAKKATTANQPKPADDPEANRPDPTNSTEPTPNSSPIDEAQDNPNAATGDASDETNEEPQRSQPDPNVPEDTTTSPTTEAQLTHADNTPTETVPAGSADATADHSADGQHNGTQNTLPQSPIHQGELSEEQKAAILEEHNRPGAVIGNIAAKFGVTPERVEQVVDEQNGVTEEDRRRAANGTPDPSLDPQGADRQDPDRSDV